MSKVLKRYGIELHEELCSEGTHCLYIEGEKLLSSQCRKESEVKKMTVKVEKVMKIEIKSYPTHMHFCRPGRKHVQSFKKNGLKLYEKLQWHGTHCLHIWGQ